ncbi:hypothetical protein C4577_02435 [Candidatus Parcubacteria bacterium]|nr:MAG: hypothetical protein C4577_02435 [Candidatus Parcubacteria bacterium]
MSDVSDNIGMTRVCRVKLEEKDLKEISNQFSRLVSSLSKSSEIEGFFDEFLTKEEKIVLTKRLVLFMMIKKQYSSSDIWSALRFLYFFPQKYQKLSC